MADGRFEEACVKLEESQSLRSGIGTQFNLAECYEKTGRTASAWSLYLRVASETKALGQAEREQVARTRSAALEPRLSRLTIEVSSPAPALEIELDGAKMTAGTWGIATPLDPGDHQLVARAPGYQSWSGMAHVEAEAGTTISVPALVALAPEAEPDAPSQPAETSQDLPAGEGTRAQSNALPYVIGGVGVAGVVIGGLLGLSVLDKNGEAKEICADRPTACPREEIERHDELTRAARRARAAGYVSVGLGLIGVGIGAAWLLDADEPESVSQMQLDLAIGDGQAGLSLHATF
jgi:serine/threonine-protein kinase